MGNRKVIMLTFIVIIGMIIVPTMYKIYDKHNEQLEEVVKKEFLYEAKKCFNESNCSDVVYLSDLYNKEYIKDKLTNPLNKKYYSDKSYINLKTLEVELID